MKIGASEYYEYAKNFHLNSDNVRIATDLLVTNAYPGLSHNKSRFINLLLKPYLASIIPPLISNGEFKAALSGSIHTNRITKTNSLNINVFDETDSLRKYLLTPEGYSYVNEWLKNYNSKQLRSCYLRLIQSQSASAPRLRWFKKFTILAKNTIRHVAVKCIFPGKKVFISDLYFRNSFVSRLLSWNPPQDHSLASAVHLDCDLRDALLTNLVFETNAQAYLLYVFALQHLPISLLEAVYLDAFPRDDGYPSESFDYALSSYAQLSTERYRVWLYSQHLCNRLFKVIVYQHGLMGVLRADRHLVQLVDEILSDILFTWGQYSLNSIDSLNYIPVGIAPPKIVRTGFRFSKRNAVCFVTQPSDILLSDQSWESKIIDIARCASLVYNSKKLHVIIKLYCDSSESRQRQLFTENILVPFAFDSHPGWSSPGLKCASLFVFTYVSTGFCEALSAGIPAMLLIDDNSHLTTHFSNLIKPLREADILHFNIPSLLEAIKKVGHDTESWQASLSTKASIDLFKRSYAQKASGTLDILRKIGRAL